MAEFADEVFLALNEAVVGRQAFAFCLHNGQGLRVGATGAVPIEHVVSPTFGPTLGLAVDDVNGPGRLL